MKQDTPKSVAIFDDSDEETETNVLSHIANLRNMKNNQGLPQGGLLQIMVALRTYFTVHHLQTELRIADLPSFVVQRFGQLSPNSSTGDWTVVCGWDATLWQAVLEELSSVTEFRPLIKIRNGKVQRMQERGVMQKVKTLRK